jgi:hypothetical protein
LSKSFSSSSIATVRLSSLIEMVITVLFLVVGQIIKSEDCSSLLSNRCSIKFIL